MNSKFTTNIAPHVQAELLQANKARQQKKPQKEFSHLENAHVLGQASTYWHVNTHVLMLLWAIRNSAPKEFVGQLLRIVGAASKTAVGLIPKGNTGGSNVSPFKVMPISPDHEKIINDAKSDV